MRSDTRIIPAAVRTASPAAPSARAIGARLGSLFPDAGTLGRFLLISYALTVAVTTADLLHADIRGPVPLAWLLVVQFSYAACYLLPAFLAAFLVQALFARGPGVALLRASRVPSALPARTVAVASVAAVQLLLFTDAFLFRRFGFHVNGFVVNLLLTRGGVESMGADSGTKGAFAGIAAAFLAVEGLALRLALPGGRLASALHGFLPRRGGILLAVLLAAAAGGERLAYGVADIRDYRPVLAVADTFPFYVPVRMRSFGRSMGWEIRRWREPSLAADGGSLDYPLSPVVRAPGARNLNVVWLVAESLRADMLDPEIMPATWRFAEGGVRFRRHFSGGNGTRMGMFSMFYGLHGAYWFPFLAERRGPVLVDLLLDGGWDVEAWTSARFTFPEFDRTILCRLPAARLHEGDPSLRGWENDRLQVRRLLASLDRVEKGKPFFRFGFLESPHARYWFPEESAIRRPWLENVNYASMDPDADVGLLKNRYVNACHHLDSQLDRVFRGLEARGLLESTLVIVTGDHGEEFMERGHWGHHSGFNRPQTMTPLVLRAPGVAPAVVDRMTSHLDIAPTVLALLGVTTPEGDWCLGHDLLGPSVREDCVVAGWDDVAIRAPDATLVLPSRNSLLALPRVLDADDREMGDDAADREMERAAPRITRVVREMGRFLR